MKTRVEWLNELKRYLSELPLSEQQRAVDYYSEMFDDKFKSGMSEKDIVEAFGSPFDCAKTIISDYNARNTKAEDDFYGMGNGDIYTAKQTEYKQIEADVDYGNISVITTNESVLSVEVREGKNYEISDANGFLKIRERNGVSVFFKKATEVRLFVPKTLACDWALRADAGRVDFDGVTGNRLYAKASAGNIFIRNANFASAEVRSEAGKITVEHCRFGSVVSSADAGSLHIDELQSAKGTFKVNSGSLKVTDSNVTDISVRAAAGAIALENLSSDNIDAHSDLGSVTGSILGVKDEYNIFVHVSLGSCNLDNQRGTTNKSLKAESNLGKVNFKFKF